MPVYVFGHRNPDTDAICSALAYADFLRQTTRPDAIAACCGTPNERTDFVLRKAGIASQKIMMTCVQNLRMPAIEIRLPPLRVMFLKLISVCLIMVSEQFLCRMKSIMLLGLYPWIFVTDVVWWRRSHQGERSSHNARQVWTSSVVLISIRLIRRVDELVVTVGAMSDGFTSRVRAFLSDYLWLAVIAQPFSYLPLRQEPEHSS